MRRSCFLLALLLLTIFAVLLFWLSRRFEDPRSRGFLRWSGKDEAERAALTTVQRDACPGAPFIMPADGFIGLLYADPRGPYSAANPHQGIDIFSNSEPGSTAVYAAYDGYLSREADWKSSLIIRVPDDPLNPGTQIWLYHTHMADRDGNDFIADEFPPGTSELFVKQGTLLGYMGNYNGKSLRNIWVHLHFSVVKDNGNGSYSNELAFGNTLDPSPYLGMRLNYECGSGTPSCTQDVACEPQDISFDFK